MDRANQSTVFSLCRNVRFWLTAIAVALLVACDGRAWNNPYPKSDRDDGVIVDYASFDSPPKTLDPARSYSAPEAMFNAQIYEPPLQYHFLKRPYQLEPLTLVAMPTVERFAKNGELVQSNEREVVETRYTMTLKPGIFYQPHPAFAKAGAAYLYHHLSRKQVDGISGLADFTTVGSRELTAADYVYQIKRLAHPDVQSPIFSFMANIINGLDEFHDQLQQVKAELKQTNSSQGFIDLRQYQVTGVKVLDRYRYQITIKGDYRQFIYWLAMPFFAPMPWEADQFYSQPGMRQKNMVLDWYPIGTGPYMLAENNPNRRIILERNPYYHEDLFPATGEANDEANGFLKNKAKSLPMIDRIVYTLEKESLPRWNKFLQGYYDNSGISSDSFDQAIAIDHHGNPQLTDELKQKQVRLYTSVEPSIFYLGFNMKDKVVGGDGERTRKLRQAISIAVDYDEYIHIFLNGRGVAAQGPIPPGIFGYQSGQQGINPIVYQWRQHQLQHRSLTDAKRLLAEAGYPAGKDKLTNKPLVLTYDIATNGGPEQYAQIAWMRKQFAKLGIQLLVNATHWNRFQDRIRRGRSQLFFMGWNADYPDPENFFFLLYGPNGKVEHGGENASNYNNPVFDQLFRQMRSMPNDNKRLAVIEKMLAIVRQDAPWVWGLHPKTFLLSHKWNDPVKQSSIINGTLKYYSLDPVQRSLARRQWNTPIKWPLYLVGMLLLSLVLYAANAYRKRERKMVKRR